MKVWQKLLNYTEGRRHFKQEAKILISEFLEVE